MTKSSTNERIQSNIEHENQDPITGEPGSHPVATAIGAAVGITAGMATAVAVGATAGAVLGPAGMALGALAGGIFGGGLGHAIGEDIYPTQIAWWKENYQSRPYAKKDVSFNHYEPAYWYGVDAAIRNPNADFESLEPTLRNNWNLGRGDSTLEWNDAAPAARDAYSRIREEAKRNAENDVKKAS
jgi:hypothetical protein